MVVTAVAHVGHGIGVGNQFCALGLKVAVAEPAVVLAAGVDHPADGLRADLGGGIADLARALRGGAAVDQHRAGRRHHQADVGVQALVVGAAGAGVAHVDVNALGDTLEIDRERLGQAGHHGKRAGHHQTRHA